MADYNFQSVFDNAEKTEEEFDTIFGSDEDGSLVDAVCGFNESGECETDFDELHNTPEDLEPDEMDDECESEDVPDGVEGTDSDPNIDLAYGETADNEFSDKGMNGETDADDFYGDNEEDISAITGEGPDVKIDNQNIGDEFDNMVEAVCGNKECDDDNDEDDESIKESDEYEEGDSDLVDLVVGDD